MRIGSALNGPHQVVRVGLLAQPARVVAGGQDQRHAVVDFCDQLVGVGGDDRERADPVSSRTLTSARPGRLAHSLFREQLPGCGVVQLGQDIRDNFQSQLPAQFSERAGVGKSQRRQVESRRQNRSRHAGYKLAALRAPTRESPLMRPSYHRPRSPTAPAM
jgi:hypothetical protein